MRCYPDEATGCWSSSATQALIEALLSQWKKRKGKLVIKNCEPQQPQSGFEPVGQGLQELEAMRISKRGSGDWPTKNQKASIIGLSAKQPCWWIGVKFCLQDEHWKKHTLCTGTFVMRSYTELTFYLGSENKRYWNIKSKLQSVFFLPSLDSNTWLGISISSSNNSSWKGNSSK